MSNAAAAYTVFLGMAAALSFCALFLTKKWILKANTGNRRFARCMVSVAPSAAIAITAFAVSASLSEKYIDPFWPIALVFGMGQAYFVGFICACAFMLVLRLKKRELKSE